MARRRWRSAAVVMMAVVAPASTWGAPDVPDPGSPVYRGFAVVAGRDAHVDRDATVTGDVHANGTAMIRAGGAVQGDVTAVVRARVDGTVSGTVTSGAPPLVLPAIPTEAESRARADRVIETSTTLTNPVIDDVLFVRGNVRVKGTLRGTGSLIATGTIKLDTLRTAVAPDPTSQLVLIAGKNILLGKLQPLRGVLLAGKNIIVKGGNALAAISIAHANVKMKKGSAQAALDFAAPAITFDAPSEAAVLATAMPTIIATLSDDLSGVDPATIRLLVDGVDRTAEAEVSVTRVAYTPAAPLADGAHGLSLSARDRAGNRRARLLSFTTDTQPPDVTVTGPTGSVRSTDGSVTLEVAFDDTTSAVDASTLVVTLDGADVTGGCELRFSTARCPRTNLAAGPHAAGVTARDVAGNLGTAAGAFDLVVDAAPPVLVVEAPTDGAVTGAAQVTVRGTATDDAGAPTVTVNGAAATLTGIAFQHQLALAEGSNAITVVAVDALARRAERVLYVIRDTVAPALAITAPAADGLVNTPSLRVAGTVRDAGGPPVVTVNGTPAVVTGGTFAATVTLAPGPTTLAVQATDAAGNTAEATRTMTLVPLPQVAITAPADLSFLDVTAVTVSGTVSDPQATVAVNGRSATLSGTAFTVADVPLIEGGNLLTAVATTPGGAANAATITVVRDLTAPRLAVEVPAAGATVLTPTVVVSGLVNDVVAGTVNASEATVTVNGHAAAVANRGFQVAVPLPLGDSVLDIVATDSSGNVGRVLHPVRRAEPAGPHLVLASGDGQAAPIGTALPARLVVSVRDGSAQPVAGVPVLFRVPQGNGRVDGARQVLVPSDASGAAAVTFTLGTRAGAASQRVEASAVGYAGAVVFQATALPGPPAALVADAGTLQWGVAGHALPRPLVAVVTDAGHNRLPAVPVGFTVTTGAGTLGGTGEPVHEVLTDSDGRAITTLTLDPAEGVASTVAEARIAALPDGPAVAFVGSGLAAGPPAATTLSGIVLDNANEPLPGVTLRLKDHPHVTTTAADGTFRLTAVPVGTLYLVVDGSTVERPGAWPDLEFVVTTIAGRDVTVGMPIYLLPLQVGEGLFVSETQGGQLTLAAVPGFALDVAPGTVTFPGGGRTGVVSATVVHSDKVPMVPNFGQQPRFIVTIQPAGARFEPPARLTLPNVEGLAPGEVTELYSFDHDLGHFVSIGPATVSDDGLVVTANPGVGLIKAGWHCGGSPPAAGATHDCGDCRRCDGSQCVPANTPLPNFDDDCFDIVCRNGAIDTVDDDSETPPQGPNDDCKREICRDGFKTTEPAYDETPPQTPGNCLREQCPQPPHPPWAPDLSDAPVAHDCCASGSGDVPPIIFYPPEECCVRAGEVVPKRPWSERCPRRVPRPGYQTQFNGCTAPLAGAFGVDRNNPAGGIDTHFSLPTHDRPCDLHDACYQTCYTDPAQDGTNRAACDLQFCVRIAEVCANTQDPDPDVRDDCFEYAVIYCGAVSWGGGRAFATRMTQACDCC